MAAENDHDIPLPKDYCARSLIPIRKLSGRSKSVLNGSQTAANIFDLIYKGEGGTKVELATAQRTLRPHD